MARLQRLRRRMGRLRRRMGRLLGRMRWRLLLVVGRMLPLLNGKPF
jgi:hypothetical protein